MHERRVAKLVKRYEADQHRISIIDNKTEVSSLTTSIGPRPSVGGRGGIEGTSIFRRYLRSSSLGFRRDRELEAPIDATISVIHEDTSELDDDTEGHEDHFLEQSSAMLSLYLDESNEGGPKKCLANSCCGCLSSFFYQRLYHLPVGG